MAKFETAFPLPGSQLVDPTTTIVCEEIVTQILCRKCSNSRVVENPTRDGASERCTAAMTVGIDRAAMSRIGCGAFGIWPTVVGPGNPIVDFFPRVLSYVIDEEPPRERLEGIR